MAAALRRPLSAVVTGRSRPCLNHRRGSPIERPVGIFDFLSGGKGGAVQKTVARANNKNAQSVDRFRALEQLRDDGSDEAIAGLLRRFSFNYDKSIEDEQEKEWVHDTIIELAAPHDAEE